MRVILIGGNKTVYFLARQFVRRKYHVTVINRKASVCHELAHQTGATVVVGDGTDVNRLEEAGARKADVVLALTQHDQDNLVACQIAQKRFGVPRTIGLVNDPDNEIVFEKLGIAAFSATRTIGALIDQETGFETITELMPLAKGKVNITDVRLPANSPVIGKSLQEIDFFGGSLVACVVRGDEVIVPRGWTELHTDDHLILISQPEGQQEDLELLCGVPVK